MKKLLFIVSIAIVIFSCEKEDRRDILLDAAPLHIYPAEGVKTSSNPLHLSAYEIVKQVHGMVWQNDAEEGEQGLGISDSQKDLTAPKIIYPADYVINPRDTTIEPTFLYAYDLTFVREIGEDKVRDTVAYIPNSVMREAERLVTAAFNKQDYLTCYEIFDSLYIFRPVTGAEWRALKKEGKN